MGARGSRARSFCVAAVLVAATTGTSLSHPAWGAGVDPGAATPVQREQAQSRFQRGKALFDKADYAGALDEFRAATGIVASPNARLYVARCLRSLNRLVEAYVELGRTEVEAREQARDDSRYARTAATAAHERAELRTKLGFVSVTVLHPTDDTSLHVAGDEILRAGWSEPSPVLPGITEIVVRRPSAEPVRQYVTLKGGEQKSISIEAPSGEGAGARATPTDTQPAPSVPPHDKARLWPYAVASIGAGAAGMVTFGVAGLLSKSAYSDLKSSCPNDLCPGAKSNEIASGKTDQTVANVGLGVGIVGLAVGATLLIIRPPTSADSGSGGTAASAGQTSLVVSPGWTGIRGTF